MLLKLCLLVVPELFPWSATVLGRGYASLEVDGAHVHNMDWVLFFERRVWYETGVYGDQVTEVRHAAYPENDRALLQVHKVLLRKLLSELEEFLIDMRV
jgi:hypothetical protein